MSKQLQRQEDTRRLLESLAMPAADSEALPLRRHSWWRWGLGGGLIVALVSGWWWQLGSAPAPAPTPEWMRVEVNPIGDNAGAAGLQDSPVPAIPPLTDSVLQASGFVVAKRQATVSADVTGRLVKIHVEEGSYVKKGQLLAELNSGIAQAQVEYAGANIELARRAAAITKVRIDEAEIKLARYRELTEKRFISREQLDTVEHQVALLEAQLASDLSGIKAATKQLEVSKQQLRSTLIFAPFSGVVTEVAAHIGEIVSPISAGGGFTRTGICTLVDLDSIEGEVNVNEQHLSRIGEGQQARVTAMAYPNQEFSGEVVAITPVVERNTAAIKVRVSLQNTKRRLMPGMRIDLTFAPMQLASVQKITFRRLTKYE